MTERRRLPNKLLYSISARIGGHGLDTDAFEALLASYRGGFLGRAIAYDNRQTEIPARFITSLRWHPIRLISFVGSQPYYGAKKRYLDWVASRELSKRGYDFVHSWSGDCLRTLRTARARKIPSIIEIPTWHRDRATGKQSAADTPPRTWKERLLLEHSRFLEEYELATLVVVLSEAARETFLERNFPPEKLFYLPRGVDIERFRPGTRPEKFRAIFSGALIKRKGVHHLLEAWHRLALPDAELLLAGAVHDEIRPYLDRFANDTVRVLGFVRNHEEYLRQSSIYVFPSQWEGSAKTVYEAAACGLPCVTTREAGDVVRDGIEGVLVRPGNTDAIAIAIQRFYSDRSLIEKMGVAARQRVEQNFTWKHYRSRLLDAYSTAIERAGRTA